MAWLLAIGQGPLYTAIMHAFTRSLLPSSLALWLALWLSGCSPEGDNSGSPKFRVNTASHLQQVQQSGELRILTRNTPSTYFQDRNGDTGFEYELASAFAQQLGVQPKPISLDNIDQLFAELQSKAPPALLAAGLTATPDREQLALFTEGYLDVIPQVIYHTGTSMPRKPTDLIGKRILVLKDSIHAERLRALQQELPELEFAASDQVESVDLLRMVNDQAIDITLVNSNELAMHQVYFPNIRQAFSLEPAIRLQWALPVPQRADDHSLLDAANAFLQQQRQAGHIESLVERYYGHLDVMGYVGANAFAKHLQQRMPDYEAMFRQAAAEYNLDWKFLAAVGYQESHWDPQARSKTGVRGLMMLTQNTAKAMGVSDRLDPAQSIKGGARFLALILEQLPDSIQGNDRYWFALAAYNVGPGHLEDARKLTEQAGLNPNRWSDVRSILPRLSQKQWYSQTRYGYARGGEPVHFVNNIRRYYDILSWSSLPLQEDMQDSGSRHVPGISNSPSSSSSRG